MRVFRGALKRVFLFAMVACLCLAAWGGAAPGEAAATEKAASMSAEELFQAGKDACEAKGYGMAQDYEKAAEYLPEAGGAGQRRGRGTAEEAGGGRTHQGGAVKVMCDGCITVPVI